MKKGGLSLFLVFYVGIAISQQRVIDSIKAQMPTSNDTLMLVWSNLLSLAFDVVDADSLPAYNKKYLELCRQLNLPLQEADALQLTAHAMARTNTAEALHFLFKAQNIVEHPSNHNLLPPAYLKMLNVPLHVDTFEEYRQYVLGSINLTYGIVYWFSGRNNRAYDYYNKALNISNVIGAKDLAAVSYIFFGILSENDDSSLYHLQKARQLALDIGSLEKQASIENIMSQRYASKQDFRSEYFYRRASLNKNVQLGLLTQVGWSYLGMADYYNRSVIIEDSGVFYSYKAMEIARQTHSIGITYWASLNLSNIYKKQGNKDSAYKYLELRLQANEKISGEENSRKFENIDYAQQSEAAAIKAAEDNIRNKVKTYSFLAGIGVLMLLAVFFWRSNKRKQREYLLLQQQKARTDEALQNLKATQMQLVQSEKMASLGELTAGIAHEIQNPLNFVNNFSDLSNELIDEMNEKLKEGSLNEAKEIATDIRQNLEKINYHGKRADGIVKGMLQHSLKSSGAKELTDINRLADEYVRLAYHGLRAKDKTFNATIETAFDKNTGLINIIPQDIGRVLLNVINNAFYAVNEKKQQQLNGYEPLVSISTKANNEEINIIVSDNGNGVPNKLLDKIFQPFFTTKPTGQGTGLGLSMAYDIIKAHGGDLKVESRENEGATFTIHLPRSSDM